MQRVWSSTAVVELSAGDAVRFGIDSAGSRAFGLSLSGGVRNRLSERPRLRMSSLEAVSAWTQAVLNDALPLVEATSSPELDLSQFVDEVVCHAEVSREPLSSSNRFRFDFGETTTQRRVSGTVSQRVHHAE